jgi:methylglyoxal synthase
MTKPTAAASKTLVGVLASHDSSDRNNALARLFERLHATHPKKLADFHFLFTGGTCDRLIGGANPKVSPISESTQRFLLEKCGITRLPSRQDGGVIILANLVVQQTCSILWPFLTPLTSHWLNPENLALLRLSDHWHVKKLMNEGSVEEWFKVEASIDSRRNLQRIPPSLELFKAKPLAPRRLSDGTFRLERPRSRFPKKFEEMTLALIAHNEMKARMIEFAIDFERELDVFPHILSTGTTGREVAANTRTLHEKIYRYRSGPKGGDIEIATQVLFGRCHVVIFFIDPLNPHPHIEDIRVVLGACMLQPNVRMLTNEAQARDWMRRVIRG